MAGLHPSAAQGRVNGLERPTPVRGPGRRVPRPAPVSLILAGTMVYAAALMFPLLLRQVNTTVFGAAVLGTALLIVGLHLRWTRAAEPA